ncbi:MAG: hypothetical protein WBQ94_04375 [Terracidiphilus sp.]
MKAFWSDTRANGQPIEAGTVCRVIDLEDGTHPIYIYGANEEEVFTKLERQNMHAQLALARRAASPSPQTPANGAAQAPPQAARAVPPRSISPDEIMQATADLSNPAKAAAAIALLHEAATGIDPIQAAREAYARLAMEWEAATPEFYPHPGNRQLVGEKAIRMAGNKPGLVTRDILNAAFQTLRQEGLLFERADEPPAPSEQISNQPTLTTFPGETQVQPTERPRGTRYATGARSTSFSAPQTVQTRALKYTEEQIRTMPERERLRVFNDPDYIRACEVYYSGARA